MRRLIVVTLSAVLLLVGLAVPVSAATTVVDCGRGQDLQLAVDEASAGDTIVVNGRCDVSPYLLVSDVVSPLTIRGGSHRPVISPGIRAVNNRLTLERLAVKGGVRIWDAALVLRRVRLYGSEGAPGLFVQTGSVTIERSVIEDNSGAPWAGGIFLGHGQLTMKDSVVRNNTAASLGGGIAIGGGQATIENSRIMNNDTGTVGGGISVTNTNRRGSLTLTKSRVVRNSADDAGGGIYVEAEAAFVATESTIKNNTPNDCEGC